MFLRLCVKPYERIYESVSSFEYEFKKVAVGYACVSGWHLATILQRKEKKKTKQNRKTTNFIGLIWVVHWNHLEFNLRLSAPVQCVRCGFVCKRMFYACMDRVDRDNEKGIKCCCFYFSVIYMLNEHGKTRNFPNFP